MDGMTFSWDDRKDRENQRKHGVSFDEATTVFLDERALLLDDPDHSEGESRFLLLGLSSFMRLLVVCHCMREGDTIRLINAPDLRKKIGEKGSKRAEALFDWDVCLQKTLDIYHQVVESTP